MRIALATCANLPDWEVDDRPLHEAFSRLGVDAPLVVWDDPRADWAAFDGCLIRTTWDYPERRDQFVRWAERVEAATCLLNPAAIVRWNTHKSYLRDLEEQGVPVVPTVWLKRSSVADLAALTAERGWSKGFLKPAVGSTARDTMRFTCTPSELESAQAHLDRLLEGEDALLQPYLPSVEEQGELSAIFIEGELTHAVRKTPVAGDYRVQDDFGARDEPVSLAPQERALVVRILGLIDPPPTYARADFLRDPGGNLCLTELELVEPSLFFRHAAHAAERLARAVCDRLERASL